MLTSSSGSGACGASAAELRARVMSGSLSSCSSRPLAACDTPLRTVIRRSDSCSRASCSLLCWPSRGAASTSLCLTARLRHPARDHRRRPALRCQAVAQLPRVESKPEAGREGVARQCTYDVVSFGNLCVDVVLQVDQLPPEDRDQRRQLLQTLSASPPDASSMEVGGACNFMIAAARLGCKVSCVGQLGDDAYGAFLREVMQAEGVSVIEPVLPPELALAQTLLCFVLVGPGGGHAFCSRYDFGPWPLVEGVASFTERVAEMLGDTRAVYLNGFVFDELEPALVAGVAHAARQAGAAVFFDPGPRCWTLLEGERRAALDEVLSLSDVVLMTEEEATAITGCSSAQDSAHWVLDRPGTCTEWAIVKRGGDGAVLCSRGAGGGGLGGDGDQVTHLTFSTGAYKVDVRDTVGCGDSFAAAVVKGYIADHSIPTVMALANAVGAATAMGSGAGRNVASVGSVADLLISSMDEEESGSCPHSAALEVLRSSVELDVDAGIRRGGSGAPASLTGLTSASSGSACGDLGANM